MKFSEVLDKKKSDILARWRELTFDTYPADSSQFLRKNTDRFANPVGVRLTEGLSGLVDWVLGENEPDEAARFLDDIMHIRAVQDFSAQEAVGFLFVLKKVIRDELDREVKKLDDSPHWRRLDDRIDAMACAGFEMYCKCRERLFEIRVKEVKSLSYKAMKRANLLCDIEPLAGEDLETSTR